MNIKQNVMYNRSLILRVFNKEQVNEPNIIKFRGKHTQLEQGIHDSISTVKLSIFFSGFERKQHYSSSGALTNYTRRRVK